MTISAIDWKHYYFLGITNRLPNELRLSQAQISSLLSMCHVNAGIATNLAIDPQLLINAKGTTVWLALFALIAMQYPKDLEAACKNETLLFLPSDTLSASFKHNNWPDDLIAKVNLQLPGHHLFVLPFLMSSTAPAPKKMDQSLKAPDGSLEIFGIYLFDEEQPHLLLKNCETLANWYQKERRQNS